MAIMTSTSDIKVLIVDDDRVLRESISTYLGDSGYKTVEAENGKEALDIFDREQPDIVLLDIRMPVLDGITALPMFIERKPEVPVIIVSGMGTLSDSIEALRAGAWDYITKPIHDMAFLEHAITRALDRAQLVRENRKYKEHLEEIVEERTEQILERNKELAESEERFRATFEQAAVGVAHTAVNGKFMRVNQKFCEILGYSHNELLTMTFRDVTHPDDIEASAQYMKKLLNGDLSLFTLEKRYIQKDGGSIWGNVTVSLVRDADGQPDYIIPVLQDISQRKAMELALERIHQARDTAAKCNAALVHADDEISLIQEICNILVELDVYVMAWVGVAAQDPEKIIRPIAKTGARAEFLDGLTIPWDENGTEESPPSRAITLNKMQIVSDISKESGRSVLGFETERQGFSESVSLPLDMGNGEKGVLTVYASEKNIMGEDEILLIEEMADDLAYGIRTLRNNDEKEQAQAALNVALLSTIRAVSLTVEKRDPYTAGHQERVSELAVAIGRNMGLDEQVVEGIRLGGLIHDIGKIYIPSEILNRPGKLTQPEFDMIKSHTTVGFDIMKDVECPWPIKEMILQHHERRDGTGYPNGLKGNDIILEAQIIAVADVVEAVSAHRPYRPAMGIEAALGILREGSGTIYNEDIANACIDLIEQQGFTWVDVA